MSFVSNIETHSHILGGQFYRSTVAHVKQIFIAYGTHYMPLAPSLPGEAVAPTQLMNTNITTQTK